MSSIPFSHPQGLTHEAGLLSGLGEERALEGLGSACCRCALGVKGPCGAHVLTALLHPQVCISFNQTDLTIKLPDGYEFKFPNRLNLEAINYLAAGGDFKIKCVAFE